MFGLNHLSRRSFTKTTRSFVPTLKLRNGIEMPQFALGTWKSPPGQTENAVKCAINNGYTNIDCANDYNNEPEVGNAIKSCMDSGVIKREELFIQAKLWNSNHRPEHIRPDLEQTLLDLQIDYLDSFVIHWPQACPSVITKPTLRTTGAFPAPMEEGSMFPYDSNGYFVSDNDSHYLETWEAMEELVDEGIVRSIGLSNFNRRQIGDILSNAKKYKPCILQNECHPYLQQKDLIDFCKCNGLVFQAFSSLGSGDTHLAVTESPTGVIPLKDPLIIELSKKYNKSPGQIILRWHVQRGNALVTKSVHDERIINNIKVYDWNLSEEDMKSFDSINYWWRHLFWRETSNHSDYPYFDELPKNYKLEKAPLVTSSGTTAN